MCRRHTVLRALLVNRWFCPLISCSLALFEEEELRMEDMEKKLEEMLTCSVCRDIFNDPRQLPCGHSMCMGCLENLRDHSTDVPFRCPDCREYFGLIIGVQKSYTLTSIAHDFRRRKVSTYNLFNCAN